MFDLRAARLRFRPFGVVGSVLEVMVGLAVMRSVLWTNEDYAVGFAVTVAVIGALIVCAGIVGLGAAVRPGHTRRSRSNNTGTHGSSSEAARSA